MIVLVGSFAEKESAKEPEAATAHAETAPCCRMNHCCGQSVNPSVASELSGKVASQMERRPKGPLFLELREIGEAAAQFFAVILLDCYRLDRYDLH